MPARMLHGMPLMPCMIPAWLGLDTPSCCVCVCCKRIHTQWCIYILLHLPRYEAGVEVGWPSRPAFKPCSMPFRVWLLVYDCMLVVLPVRTTAGVAASAASAEQVQACLDHMWQHITHDMVTVCWAGSLLGMRCE
jgi:hypothetical protein